MRVRVNSDWGFAKTSAVRPNSTCWPWERTETVSEIWLTYVFISHDLAVVNQISEFLGADLRFGFGRARESCHMAEHMLRHML